MTIEVKRCNVTLNRCRLSRLLFTASIYSCIIGLEVQNANAANNIYGRVSFDPSIWTDVYGNIPTNHENLPYIYVCAWERDGDHDFAVTATTYEVYWLPNPEDYQATNGYAPA